MHEIQPVPSFVGHDLISKRLYLQARTESGRVNSRTISGILLATQTAGDQAAASQDGSLEGFQILFQADYGRVTHVECISEINEDLTSVDCPLPSPHSQSRRTRAGYADSGRLMAGAQKRPYILNISAGFNRFVEVGI